MRMPSTAGSRPRSKSANTFLHPLSSFRPLLTRTATARLFAGDFRLLLFLFTQCGTGQRRPAHHVLLGYFQHALAPSGVVVQARNEMKLLAAGMQKLRLGFYPNLFQGFQAIAGKTRTHHIHTGDALARQLLQRRRGIGLQPLGLAERDWKVTTYSDSVKFKAAASKRAVL